MLAGFNYNEALKTRAQIEAMISVTEEQIRTSEQKKKELEKGYGEERFLSPIKELFDKLENTMKDMRMNVVQYHILLNDLNEVIQYAVENN